MTILDELKGLVEAKGGVAVALNTIDEAVHALVKLEDSANPLSALTVDVSIAADENLLGKVISDLQSNVVVKAKSVAGTLKYVDDYTGFSGDPDEQVGHYLAIHASVPEVDDVTIKIKVSTKAGEKALDSDGILVLRVKDTYKANDLRLTFIATKSGYADYSKTFDLTELVLAPAED